MTDLIRRPARLGGLCPLTRVVSLSEVMRQFTPNWFAVTMGTGIVALDLAGLPVEFTGRMAAAEALWLGAGGLYLLFSVLFIGRLVLFSETVKPMLRHPVQSMFLGAIPMGLVPAINGCLIFGGDLFGTAALPLAHALWWLDVVLAAGVALLVPYLMLIHQEHVSERITPVWLLPIVGPEVTAASGGLLAPHLGPDAAQLVVGTGYVLWAISVPLAFSIVTIVFQRYALHKLPPTDMAASFWLILGPIGTGSLGLLTLGQAAPAAFANTVLSGAADMARNGGLLGGVLLWGAGAWWLLVAVMVTWRYWRQGMGFNLGWWGFTFPLGVYTAATLWLARLTGFFPLALIGIALTLALGLIWVVVAWHTARGMWHGHLFRAPCLAVPEPRA